MQPPGFGVYIHYLRDFLKTRRPERVLSPGAGITYNITVNVPPSANKADVGRQVVEAIREYERCSGAGWRN